MRQKIWSEKCEDTEFILTHIQKKKKTLLAVSCDSLWNFASSTARDTEI